jgi:hypothetical protein
VEEGSHTENETNAAFYSLKFVVNSRSVDYLVFSAYICQIGKKEGGKEWM